MLGCEDSDDASILQRILLTDVLTINKIKHYGDLCDYFLQRHDCIVVGLYVHLDIPETVVNPNGSVLLPEKEEEVNNEEDEEERRRPK